MPSKPSKVLLVLLVGHLTHLVAASQVIGVETSTSPPQNSTQEALLRLIKKAQAIVDPPQVASSSEMPRAELCYLADGSSSLTLTVNEATQVGAVVGAIEVNGNPALEGGNVDLYELSEWPARSTGDGLASAQPASTSKQRRLLGRRSADVGEPARVPPDDEESPSRRTSVAPPLRGLSSEPNGALLSSGARSFYSVLGGAGPPVRLEPGTKNLVLVRPLDKEAAEADQSLVVGVRCSPRDSQRGRTDSPDSTTIPIRVIVTDANDHAPQFQGPQPYVVNISETTPLGTIVSRDILALDRDSAGPYSTLHYRVLDSSDHAHLVQFANPLEPALSLAGPLDYESLQSFTVTIEARDQGEPEPLWAQAQVQVNVIDFDDQNPRFLDEKYTLVMDETQQAQVGHNLQVLPRNLFAEDGDRGIQAPILYSFDQSGAQEPSVTPPQQQQQQQELGADIERYLHLNPTSGEIRLIRQWPGKWTGPPLTLVVRATQADNRDRYTLTTLTVRRSPLGQHNQVAAVERQTTPANKQSAVKSQGIEFAPEKLLVEVPEDTPVNEKIARVRAKFLASQQKDQEAVDLVQEPPRQLNGTLNGKARPRNGTNSAATDPTKRPISYLILDDQTGQFGINGLGELFLKRPLDFEQRQEYKIRVLATYTKYSDICQVQVNVINVNDNKPKFTQALYTFHATETRLRSNSIGQVSAHDADLNDTVWYSLSGEHAHLFTIHPTSGWLSVRANIKQLNVSNCQLLVQARDSLPLVNQSQHTQQVRVQVIVAPQLVGRSLSLEPAEAESKQFNSRSLADGELAADWQAGYSKPAGASNQRSSVATVMSSLQHMVRSVNLFDMPMSSALLLSALLAFMICLLLIVVVSMSVHLYRRRSKQRQHRRHLVAAAHHLRQTHLAAMPRPGGPPTAGQTQQRPPARTHSSQSPSSGSSASPSLLHSPRSPDQRPYHPTGKLMSAKVAPSQPQQASSGPQVPANNEASILSSLSSQSKRSYRSNTTDDSSVIQCGHYSITGSHCQSPAQATRDQRRAAASQRSQSIEAAIKSLVEDTPSPDGSLSAAAAGRPDETDDGRPGIKSYRKLALNSLLRQPNLIKQQQAAGSSDSSGQDSAIDTCSPARRPGVKTDAKRRNEEPCDELEAPQIRWPRGAIPSKVKKLTWDDELSFAGNVGTTDECYVAPELRHEIMSPTQSLSNHQYPIQGTSDENTEHHFAEQHFLFSNNCSPVVTPALDFGATLTRQQQQPISLVGNQNNGLDYTIVQSSQFQVDSLVVDSDPSSRTTRLSAPSLSAQHHLLQQQHHLSEGSKATSYYLYSQTEGQQEQEQQQPQQQVSSQLNVNLHQDLNRLMTTAVL